MLKVVHLTSVNLRHDTRNFLKLCQSLARAGYHVTYVVADGKGNETRDGVDIVDAGASRNRLYRMMGATRRVLAVARRLDADVYHLHDPELIPAGLALRRLGKCVIFDAHEDLPKQLMGKHYLPPWTRWVLAKFFTTYEHRTIPRLSGVTAATPFIENKFRQLHPRTVGIYNFPLPGELESGAIDWTAKRPHVAYVGGIARIRGILEVVQAMGQVQSGARLQLVGKFTNEDDEERARALPGWSTVDALGFRNRAEVRDVLKRAIAGIVTFLPMPNHVDAQPNKMFEYMSAGVPVIASGFPLWREIIDGHRCGICVDPLNPREIAEAVDYLATHPGEAEQMGRNGQRAVHERYSWSAEERKLIGFYRQFTG